MARKPGPLLIIQYSLAVDIAKKVWGGQLLCFKRGPESNSLTKLDVQLTTAVKNRIAQLLILQSYMTPTKSELTKNVSVNTGSSQNTFTESTEQVIQPRTLCTEENEDLEKRAEPATTVKKGRPAGGRGGGDGCCVDYQLMPLVKVSGNSQGGGGVLTRGGREGDSGVRGVIIDCCCEARKGGGVRMMQGMVQQN